MATVAVIVRGPCAVAGSLRCPGGEGAMSLEDYLAFLLAVTVFVLLPGPSAMMVVANSLRYGLRAGLLTVAGRQIGVMLVILLVVGLGLATFAEADPRWFDAFQLAGALYLIWLGWKMLRAPAPAPALATPPAADAAGAAADLAAGPGGGPGGGFMLQGAVVVLGNPKALLFFAAFFPQFISPKGNPDLQRVLLCATAFIVSALGDGAYAVLAGRLRKLLGAQRIRQLTMAGGLCMIGGGLWLALWRSL